MGSFFADLWGTITGFFSTKIPLGSHPVTTLNIIIWSLCIGFILAVLLTVYNKAVPGSLVRKLRKSGAENEETALSVSDLKIKPSHFLMRMALRRNGSLRRVVSVCGQPDMKMTKENFSHAKFYIAEPMQKRADSMYGKKGMRAGTVVLAVIAILLVSVLSFKVIPGLIDMTDHVVSEISSSDDNTY